MMKAELLDTLRVITEEEKKILSGEDGIDRNLYMETNGDVINSKKMLSAGKLITVRPHTRFVHFPEHTHDYVEVIYMCSGSTTHIIDGDRIVLKEGDLLFLSQNARQEILPAGKEDIAVNFIILPAFFDSTLQMLGEEETPLRRFLIECLKENSSAGYLHFEVADVLPVQNLVENLIWTLIHETPNKRNINQTTMGLLFLQLMNHADRLVSQREEERTLVQVLRYIEEHYKEGTLTELAALLHYEFTGLSREIKRKTGKNYTELVQEKRLSQACFLLKSTNLNVETIAGQVGYDNVSYFHRLFRKQFGVSPKKYRGMEG